MAHFAKISEENKVLTVIVVNDKDVKNSEGVEVESIGQANLEKNHNWPAHLWIQTSYNTQGNTHTSGDNSKAFRGNYAGIGYTWDSENQIFWPPKPYDYDSWVKDIATASWISPIGDVPYLTEEEKGIYRYEWDEANQVWNKIDKRIV
jgi:hypothetical protein